MGIMTWLFGKKKRDSIIGSEALPAVEAKTPMPKVKPVKKASGKKKGPKSVGPAKRRRLSSEMPKAKKPRVKRRSSGTRAGKSKRIGNVGPRANHLYDGDELFDTFEDELDNGYNDEPVRSYTADTPVVVEDVSTPSYSSPEPSSGGWGGGGGGGYDGGSSDCGGGGDD